MSDIKSECNKVLLVFLLHTYVFEEYIKDLLSFVTFAVKCVYILVFHLAFSLMPWIMVVHIDVETKFIYIYIKPYDIYTYILFYFVNSVFDFLQFNYETFQ